MSHFGMYRNDFGVSVNLSNNEKMASIHLRSMEEENYFISRDRRICVTLSVNLCR